MRVQGAGLASLDHVFSILEEMLIHDYLSWIHLARIQAKFKVVSLEEMSIHDY